MGMTFSFLQSLCTSSSCHDWLKIITVALRWHVPVPSPLVCVSHQSLSPHDLSIIYFMLYARDLISGLVLTKPKYDCWLLLAFGLMYLWEESPKEALRQTYTVLAESLLPTWPSNRASEKKIHPTCPSPFLQPGTLMRRGSHFPLQEKKTSSSTLSFLLLSQHCKMSCETGKIWIGK